MTTVPATEDYVKRSIKLQFLILLAVVACLMSENAEASSRGGFGNVKSGIVQRNGEEITRLHEHLEPSPSSTIYTEMIPEISLGLTRRSPSEIRMPCGKDCSKASTSAPSDPTPPGQSGRRPGAGPTPLLVPE